MTLLPDCNCADFSFPTSNRFVTGAMRPPVTVEHYDDTEDDHARAESSLRQHRQEERQAKRSFYWSIHVGASHALCDK